MSLVHPGLINAKAGADRLHQANFEVRQYLQTEYREKDSVWIACDVPDAGARTALTRGSTKAAERSEVQARPRGRLPSFAIISENRLARWLVPKGDSVGER